MPSVGFSEKHYMKTNLTLIGMPGAGKSTTGIILAKNLGLGFIDTDILIQINQQQRLQEILDTKGYLDLRMVEEKEILKINIEMQQPYPNGHTRPFECSSNV